MWVPGTKPLQRQLVLLTTNPSLQAQGGGSVVRSFGAVQARQAAGVWSTHHAIAAVREQTDECQCTTCFLLLFPSAAPVRWIVMPTFRAGLPASSTQSRNSTDKPKLCSLSDSTQSRLTVTRYEPFLEGEKKKGSCLQ